jgi:hypothetical protein
MIRRLLTALSVLALVATGAMADGDVDATAVTALTATATDGVVSVAGTADYGPVARHLVGNQGAPSLLGEPGMELGAKIDEAVISQPDPVTGDLVFNFVMQDIEFSQVPEFIQYYWDFTLRQASGQSVVFSIGGKASTAAGAGAPRFTLNGNCEQVGNLIQCESFGPVPGQLDVDAGTVRVRIPSATLAARNIVLDGAEVRAAAVRGGIAAQPSQVAVNAFAFQYNVTHRFNYGVGRSVGLDLVGADGTKVNTATGTIDGDAFSASFAGVAPGSYTVRVKACFGTNCTTAEEAVVVE